MIPNNLNNNSSEFCYLNISMIYKNFRFPDRISIILSAVLMIRSTWSFLHVSTNKEVIKHQIFLTLGILYGQNACILEEKLMHIVSSERLHYSRTKSSTLAKYSGLGQSEILIHFCLNIRNARAWYKFGFFSSVGYLHPKDYIKSVKNPFLNLEVNNLYHALAFLMLRVQNQSVKIGHS